MQRPQRLRVSTGMKVWPSDLGPRVDQLKMGHKARGKRATNLEIVGEHSCGAVLRRVVNWHGARRRQTLGRTVVPVLCLCYSQLLAPRQDEPFQFA